MVPKTLILTGTTASGKTSLAIDLAVKQGGIEIINADSMLVYRGMNIGTAKPPLEERGGVPHHLIDIRTPDKPFTAGDFVRSAHEALADIHARKKRALIVGGTGFYLKALLYGLWDADKSDPGIRKELDAQPNENLFRNLQEIDIDSAVRIGTNDRYRLIRALEIFQMTGKTPGELRTQENKNADPSFVLWITDRDNLELYERIHQRTNQMLKAGLVDEVRAIREMAPESRALSAVGYTQVCAYLTENPPSGRKLKPGLEGLAEEIELATRQLVKRQRTWFRGQKTANWFILDRDLRSLTRDFEVLYSSSG